MIKYHAQFLLDKEKDKPTAKLRYRIKWSGFIVAFNVGYSHTYTQGYSQVYPLFGG